MVIYMGDYFLSENAENIYRIKIAIQISLIFWITLGILIFYAIFDAGIRMCGTLILLLTVVIFTPFLPEGVGYEDKET
jgi:hypothetical protein